MVDSVRHPRSTLRLTPPSCAESGRKQSRVLLDGLSASSHLVRPRRPPPYRRVSRTVQVGARPAGLGMRRNNEGAHARDRFEHRLQVTAGLSIVLLAGWGLLATALTFRAFARLGMRAVGKRGGRMGLFRLLVGVSSILLNAAGARVIASLLPSKAAGLAWFLAAVAFLVYRGLRDMRRNMRLTRPLPVGDLGRALGVQVALLPCTGSIRSSLLRPRRALPRGSHSRCLGPCGSWWACC